MAKVLFNEKSYECARAVKGVDYIKLYDENNNVIVAFASISDFSAFTLEEGQWEKGISTDAVSASAKLVNSSIQLDLLKRSSVETGLLITFQAPCDYTDANNIIIESVSFRLVDALGVSIEAGVQAFVSGAMVAVILNREDSSAYIQNAAVSPHKHSISNVENLQATLNGKASTSHKHTKSQITDFPTSMPASDVYSWAKQPNKPSYTPSEIGAAPAESFEELAAANIKNLVIQKIMKSCAWTAPKAVKQLFKVFVVGAGGGGAYGIGQAGGGGGGYVTISELNIAENTKIDIVCGASGTTGADKVTATDGGNTTFGNLLSANGGKVGNGAHGGDGGAGGGGGSKTNGTFGNGGNGAQFGGGGAGYNYSNASGNSVWYDGTPGTGGDYGAKGGKHNTPGGNTNDKPNKDPLINLLFEHELITAGTGGTSNGAGGGGAGFHGNGGSGGSSHGGGGGGGGYCCAGGKGSTGAGGGGGGFFCDGSDGSGGNAAYAAGGHGGGFFGYDGGVLIMYVKEGSEDEV